MLYRLPIHITPQDYCDLNVFVATKSDYGKKQINKARICFAILIGVFVVLCAFMKLFMGFALAAVLVVVMIVLWPHIMAWAVRLSVKDLVRKGKAGYDPDAEFFFYEDHLEEHTPNSITTQSYSGIERISVISGKTIYLHLDNMRAYVIPMSTFDSPEHCEQFLSFLKSKIACVKVY